MSEQRKRHEFKVVIEGVALSPETVLSIDQAVRTAVTHVLANTDLSAPLALKPLPGSLTEEVATGRFSLSSITPWNTTSGFVANPLWPHIYADPPDPYLEELKKNLKELGIYDEEIPEGLKGLF
jgi:hypothetical protein